MTGGGGYIGASLVKELCDLNHLIFVVDRENKSINVDKRAVFMGGELIDDIFLEEIFNKSKYDVLIHLASNKDARESEIFPERYLEDITILNKILCKIEKSNVKKVIFPSTAGVYGELNREATENDDPNPKSFYSFSKLECEKILSSFCQKKNINTIIFRFFNVAGKGGEKFDLDLDCENLFNKLYSTSLSGDMFKIYGNKFSTRDGTCIRDFVHVKDVIDAIIKGLNMNVSDIINIGSSKGYSVNEVINSFSELLEKKILFEVVEEREGEIPVSLCSNKKAKTILDWEPKYNLSDMVLDFKQK